MGSNLCLNVSGYYFHAAFVDVFFVCFLFLLKKKNIKTKSHLKSLRDDKTTQMAVGACVTWSGGGRCCQGLVDAFKAEFFWF